LFEIADLYDIIPLCDALSWIMWRDFDEIVNTEGFQKLPPQVITTFYKCANRNILESPVVL